MNPPPLIPLWLDGKIGEQIADISQIKKDYEYYLLDKRMGETYLAVDKNNPNNPNNLIYRAIITHNSYPFADFFFGDSITFNRDGVFIYPSSKLYRFNQYYIFPALPDVNHNARPNTRTRNLRRKFRKNTRTRRLKKHFRR
jgi:hypothetical protein